MKLNDLELFLFDWDGCIGDTLSAWLDAYRVIYSEFGLELSDEVIIETSFGDWEGPLKNGMTQEQTDAYAKRITEYLEPILPKVEINPNIKELLELLQSKGKKIGIVTSSKLSLVESTAKFRGIWEYFDHIVTVDDVKKAKPDPEMVNKSLEHFKIDKERAVIVGDTENDILAGQRAGCHTILYYPEKYIKFYKESGHEEKNPEMIIRDFNELILKLNNGD